MHKEYVCWNAQELVLDNGLVRRVISLPVDTGRYLTTAYAPKEGEFTYFTDSSVDFSFVVNDTEYSGAAQWRVEGIAKIEDALEGKGAQVTLQSADGQLAVRISYLLYPNLPVIRKQLEVTNLTQGELSLESVDVEKLHMIDYFPSTFGWIYSDYGRKKSIGPFEGTMQDSMVILHNMDWESGVLIGNEASGVMKHISIFSKSLDICCGLTHRDARFPFVKYIKPGETFATPQVFTMVYNRQRTPEYIQNAVLPEFIRKHMGIRLSVLAQKPLFVYNTWEPFLTDINEQLIRELAKDAAEAGIKEFVIDDGWEDEFGDWGCHKEKFPNGLKPLFDYIKSLGMKPGLWVSVGSASSKSKVFKEHPEWFLKEEQGNFGNLHVEDGSLDICSACFSTGWKDYIKDVLCRLIEEHGLEYLKLDFAIVASAYRYDPNAAGCCAKDHDHKDRRESLNQNYERMWEMFDELHALHPEVFIDCTFEAMGGLQLVDYALLKHAEGDWLSNFVGNCGEKTDLRIRNMAWWRSPAIPATSLVIGNAQMQDEGWELHMKSLAGALPMFLGDPRQLSDEDKKKYRFYADWMADMSKRYDIMSYRQDLLGFSEPMEGAWDGFQRINTDTREGGIIGVFKQGALDDTRRVVVSYLHPDRLYAVKTMQGDCVVTLSGKELGEKGFAVTLSGKYDGELFEIAKQ